jgi:hypothetical protein
MIASAIFYLFLGHLMSFQRKEILPKEEEVLGQV